MTQPPFETDLATQILAIYRAPLEDFIGRRDALAKELRAAKRRDDAALVKALRKPSRIAWTLDGIAREDPASIEHLAAAIAEAQTGADLRAALDGVKEAVRDVAAAGARVAVRAEHPIEPNALITAVQAIIGDESAFAEFRVGRLSDVPDGGGLNLLFALTANTASQRPAPSITPPPVASPPMAPPPPPTEPAKPDPQIELAATARAEVHRTELLLAEARERSEQAAESLRDANARIDIAERALANAQAELELRRSDFERARREAQATATNLRDAQRAVDDARTRLSKI